jgi:hypothetical protein
LAGLILNVPYGSPYLPKPVHKRLSLTDEQLAWENWHLTDPFLLDLVKKAAEPADNKNPISRAVVKGAPDNDQKPANCLVISYPFSPLVADPLGLLAVELGQTPSPQPFILTRGTQEKDLPAWNSEEKQFIFTRCVNPYLDQLIQGAKKLLTQEKMVILINIRFFSLHSWLHDEVRPIPKPQINLGFMDKKTPQGLVHLIGHIFKTFGLWTEMDFPLSGTAMPKEMLPLPRLLALGLSFRRDLYLDETKAVPKTTNDSLIRVLKAVINLISQELDRVAEARIKRAYPPKAPSNIIKAQ